MVLAQGKSRRLKAGLGGPNQKDEERCFVWPVCMAARLVKLAFREGFTMRVRASVLMTAAFMDVSLNQWMALTPPELVQAHLNLDRHTMAALQKDKPIIVK
jgi:hypothetical protein